MRILITGISGFIGQATALRAINEGHQVFGLSRNVLPKNLLDNGVIPLTIPGWPLGWESTKVKSTFESIGELDAIIHLSGDARYGNKNDYSRSNVLPTENLLQIFGTYSPTSKFVFASSIGAQDYPRMSKLGTWTETTPENPLSEYGRSKLLAEKYVRNSGLSYAVARLGMVVGPNMRADSHLNVLVKSLENPIIRNFLARARGSMPLLDINDAATALLHLASNQTPDGTYLVVTENMPISRIVTITHGVKVRKPWIGLGRLSSLLPPRIAPVLAPLLTFSNSKLCDTGWEPGKSLSNTISNVAMAQQDNGGIAVVTGVGSGLGRSVCMALLESGHNVIGVDYDASAISELQSRFTNQTFICADVRTPDLFSTLVMEASKRETFIDSLFLVAGIGSKIPFVEQAQDNYRAQFEINVLARLDLANQFLCYIKAFAHPTRLVIISSSSALQPLPSFATYCATNAALLSFGRALAMEVEDKGCHVLTVVPSGMDTNFQSSAGVKRLKNEKLLSPDLVAAKTLSASKKRSGVLLLGRNARITNALSRILPTSLSDKLWKQITKVAR